MDFLPEPKSLPQNLRMSTSTNEKWGETLRTKLIGLFDSDIYIYIFSLTEKISPADEIIPTKLVLKTI